MATEARDSSDSSIDDDDGEEILLPPNLIWKLALLIFSDNVHIMASRETNRFTIMFHRHHQESLEIHHVNFRDFQNKLYDQVSRLPDPYMYFDHVGSFYVQDKCLLLEVHFTSEKQIKNCLKGIKDDIVGQMLSKSFKMLMKAKESIVLEQNLVVCSSIDQKLRFVTDDNATYAFELVYTPNPAFATFHARGKEVYQQLRSAYDSLLAYFPGFFGGIPSEIGKVASSTSTSARKTDSSTHPTEVELHRIANEMFPKKWQALGLHLGLKSHQLERLEIDNRGDVVKTIFKMLCEARNCITKGFRKILAVALCQSHHPELAMTIDPSLDCTDFPKINPTDLEEENSKLCFVHGEMKFYDKGLATEYLKEQSFWSNMKEAIVPMFKEKLGAYSVTVLADETGSLLLKVSMISYSSTVKLTEDIASHNFLADLEESLKGIGYRDTLIVEFKINGINVTPENCYNLYLEALFISMTASSQHNVDPASKPVGKLVKSKKKGKKPLKFKKFTSKTLAHETQQDTKIYSIFEAIQQSDSDALRQLLSSGANPNEYNQGYSPLHTAALLGKEDLSTILVQNGAKVDLKTASEEQYTPLHISAFSGNVNVAKVLVDLGAEVDSRSTNGRTPLRLAAAEGYANIAEFLISKGADPNTQDSNAITPLHVAAGLNRKSVITVLIDAGADITIPDNQGSTSIHEALKTKDVDLLKLLLHKNPSAVNQMDVMTIEPPLIAACKLQCYEVVEFLLTEMLADPNIQNKDNMTPLALACLYENLPLIDLLVTHGANLSMISPHFGSVLHLSANKGKDKSTMKLLQLNMPCDIVDQDNYTPLRDAILKGQHETTRILLKAGASITLGTPPGKLPLLHLAARSNDVSMLQILIDNNCDIYETPADGSTALHHAANCGKSEAIHFLCSQTKLLNVRSVAGITPLYSAVRQRNFDSALEILLYNPDVNIRSHRGHSPLLVSVDFDGPIELIKQFVLHDANIHYPYKIRVDGKAIDLKSPIQLACQKGQAENVKVFLQAHPNFLHVSEPPLHHLLLFSTIESGNLETLQILLSYGINPNAMTNNESLSAMIKVCFHGNVEMLQLLIDHGGNADMPSGDVGVTPLIVACEQDRIDLVEIIAKEVDVNRKLIHNGYTALHKTATVGNPEIARILLDCGAEVDIQSHDGLTPLQVAASAGNDEVIDVFLGHNADLNIQDKPGTTALMRAVQDHRYTTAEKLIHAGSDIELRALNGLNVLHFAAYTNDIATIKLLSQKGISPNVQDDSGTAPIHLATTRGNKATVEALISGGASVNIINEEGFSPLHLAVHYDYVDIAELLMNNGANIELEVEKNKPANFSKSQKMDRIFGERMGRKVVHEEKEKKSEEKSEMRIKTSDTSKRDTVIIERTEDDEPNIQSDKIGNQTQTKLREYAAYYEVIFSTAQTEA